MKIRHLAAVSLLLASLPAWADGQALAMKNNCMGCHAVDKKMVGPSYKDIAAKYKGKDSAALVKKVKAGGSGVWGAVAMPPSAASEADVKTIVDWIMTH